MPDNETTSPAAAAAATSTFLAEESSTKQQQENNNSNPFLNIFSNFLNFLKSVLPPQKKNPIDDSSAAPSEAQNPTKVEAEETKPNVVSFPKHNIKDESLISLKLQPDEIQEPNTNPVVLWQVYAIGGFLVLRWAWTRWNERKSRKKPSDEEPPPPSGTSP